MNLTAILPYATRGLFAIAAVGTGGIAASFYRSRATVANNDTVRAAAEDAGITIAATAAFAALATSTWKAVAYCYNAIPNGTADWVSGKGHQFKDWTCAGAAKSYSTHLPKLADKISGFFGCLYDGASYTLASAYSLGGRLCVNVGHGLGVAAKGIAAGPASVAPYAKEFFASTPTTHLVAYAAVGVVTVVAIAAAAVFCKRKCHESALQKINDSLNALESIDTNAEGFDLAQFKSKIDEVSINIDNLKLPANHQFREQLALLKEKIPTTGTPETETPETK